MRRSDIISETMKALELTAKAMERMAADDLTKEKGLSAKQIAKYKKPENDGMRMQETTAMIFHDILGIPYEMLEPMPDEMPNNDDELKTMFTALKEEVDANSLGFITSEEAQFLYSRYKKESDQKAFNTLVIASMPFIMAICDSYFKREQRYDIDVLEQCVVDVYEAIGSYDGKTKWYMYVTGIVCAILDQRKQEENKK